MSGRSERMRRLEERDRLVDQLASAQQWDKELEMADYFVVDIETSGFNPVSDLVLSLAAATMSGPDLKMEMAHYDLVRQEDVSHVPEQIWLLTGLSAQRLEHGGEWREILLKALSTSANRVWVAHHARHELSFFQRHARQFWKMKLRPLVIDTSVVAQCLFRLSSPPTLEDVCERLLISVSPRHHADEDVAMTTEVWLREMTLCRKLGLSTVGEVILWATADTG